MPDVKIVTPEQEMRPEMTPEAPLRVPEQAPSPEAPQPQEKATPNKRVEPVAPQPVVSSAAPIVSSKNERLQAIENLLAEDLEDVYFNLPPKDQQIFKKQGEETANKIEKLLQKTRVNVRKILSLIKKWLKLIPGVNQYFLEQESKIKVDKILKLKE